MKTGRLVIGVFVFVAITLAEILAGLQVDRPYGGTDWIWFFPGRGRFPSWLWPIFATVALLLIWLCSAWLLVIRPVRHGLIYGKIEEDGDGTITAHETEGIMDPHEEGWYTDPYEIHEHRWLSGGNATKLVRDHGVESYDEPPDTPPLRAPEPVEEAQQPNGEDMVRADAAESVDQGFHGGFMDQLNELGKMGPQPF